MQQRAIRSFLLVPIALFAILYLVSVLIVATDDRSFEALELQEVPPQVIALFGASGTAGDGILKGCSC